MDYSQNANKKRTDQTKKTRKKKKNRFGVFFMRAIIILLIVGCFGIGGALLGAYMGIIENTEHLNTTDVTPESYTSFIYDQDGNEIDMLHGKENREYVQLSEIPEYLKNAVVAIEDERFYEHSGIDVKGIFRAIVVNIKNGDFTQGASTITQQLIKNEALTSEKTITRKIQEQYLAVTFEKELEKKFGSKERAKDYILELYLNSIALNHGLNGVQSASKFYYGKDVSELTLAECASIAGITKNPSKYSPVSYPENNKERQLTVLGKMKQLGYITEDEYNQAKEEDIYSKIVGNNDKDETTVAKHNYFVDALIVDIAKDLMEQKGMNKQQAYNKIYSGGLKIYSTIDTNMQNIMEESYKNDSLFPPKGNTIDVTYTISVMDTATEKQSHYSRTKIVNSTDEIDAFVKSVQDEVLDSTHTLVLDNLVVAPSLQSAMVVMDYRTGAVKALIGGRGEKTGDLVFNRATQALRQPGSCFKILASYAPAFDLGIVSPGTVIVDEEFTVGNWTPKNWYKGYRGPQTARVGIRDSMNILAAKVIMQVGVETAFEYLENFGFTSLVKGVDENGNTDMGPALSLGGITKGVSVLELTAAYGAIANKGEYLKPTLYSKVLDHDGNVLLEYKPEPKRVIKETTAFLLTDCMKDVVSGGGTGGLARFKNLKMPIAGKTGTTSDDKDLTFAGYTPYYVAGIWLGYDQPKRMTYDKSYHLLLWSDVMEKIHQYYNLEYKDFEKVDGITRRTICSVSGKSAVPGLCDSDYFGSTAITDYFVSDFDAEPCDVHKSFKVDISTGKLANEYCPPESVKDVILAVDPETGELLHKNDKSEVEFNLNETCTEHKQDYIIGSDPEIDNPFPDIPIFPPNEEDTDDEGDFSDILTEPENNSDNNNSNSSYIPMGG